MNTNKAQTERTTIVLLTVISFLISLTPRVPAKPTAPVKKQSVTAPSADKTARTLEAYGNLPLSFEPNHGQADQQVKFLTRGSGYALLLTATDAFLALNDSSETEQGVRMRIVDGNPSAKLTGERQLEGNSNYLIGSDQRKWTREVPTYGGVRATGVYPGVDVVYYGSDQKRLEYDFVVSPGADPCGIRLAFEGAETLSLDAEGSLRLKLKDSEMVQPAPVIYQEIDSKRQSVAGHYLLTGGNEVVFEIGEYDRSHTLVIDPELVYASFHGGSGDDRGEGVAVDANGNAYVVGSTGSANLAATGAFQGSLRGTNDIFIVKINAAGTARVYSTFLGSSGDDFGYAIAVTSDGKACITGYTDNSLNSNYPTTSNRYQGNGVFQGRGTDVVVTMLNAAGNGLVYSTFLGGGDDNDGGNGIALDGGGKIYVTGFTLSRNFPTKHAFQNSNNYAAAFVAKFDPTESGNDSLVYSSFLGGSERDEGTDIAVTANGVAFVTGTTESQDFPTKSSSALPAFQTIYGGGSEDIFVAKVSPAGGLIYSTFFGGNGLDNPGAIAVDANERVYLTGLTVSSAATFPLRNAFDATRTGFDDAFVAKFNADGTTLFYSSFISGSTANNQGEGIAVDAEGNAFVTGTTAKAQTPFPVVNGFPASVSAGNVFFVKVGPSDATGSTAPAVLISDTLPGGAPSGLALDPDGNVYIAGSVTAGVISGTPGAFQPAYGGGSNDAYALKITFPAPDTIGVFRNSTTQFLLRNSNTTGGADLTFAFGQPGDKPIAGDWSGNGTTDVGVFRNGQFLLRQPFNIPGRIIISTITVNFGQAGDLPVVGDWNGDGIDTPGVFRPATAQWLLTNGPNTNNSTPPVDITFSFGLATDTPLAGDWNGDGIDTVGLFRGSIATFILSDTFTGTLDVTPFLFGSLGSVPVTGDWNGDGVDTVGVFNSNIGVMALNNTNTSGNGAGDIVFNFGQSGDRPLAGDWDGKP